MGSVSDSEDLEALFEQVAAEAAAKAAAAAPETAPAPAQALSPEDVFRRVGEITRTLHDALRELGHDKSIESIVGSMPDVRSRMGYVAELTGKAAERVLGAVERAKSSHDAVSQGAEGLRAQWARLYAGELSVDEFKALAARTRDFFGDMPERCRAVDAELTEIMMAQDFHDLTGQVLQKLGQLAQRHEEALVKLLLETTPPGKRAGVAEEGWLNGPAIDTKGRTDVVTSQAQVDDLLESLGF